MHPTKTISSLGFSPILQKSACRSIPFLLRQDLYKDRLPFNSPTFRENLRIPSRPNSANSPRLFSTSVPVGSVSFRAGAAYSAKNTRINIQTDTCSFDFRNPEGEIITGRPRSGQDAFFVTKVGKGDNIAFGVADGVGGWMNSGIDSAHFSHALCKSMATIARDAEDSGNKLRPQELLLQGYDKVVADRSISGGGSTACIAVGKADGNLEVANLGDSGFVQLRLNAIHQSSNPQTHAFNTPYQLSIIPPKVLARARAFGGKPLSDIPGDASITNHKVRHGDVLVFATDGVWDNLSSRQLLKIVCRKMQGLKAWVAGDKGITVSEKIDILTQTNGIPAKKGNALQTLFGGVSGQIEMSLQDLLALTIAREAKGASLNRIADGPFAREVQKFYPHENYHGGKVDDICVIVVIVVKNEKE